MMRQRLSVLQQVLVVASLVLLGTTTPQTQVLADNNKQRQPLSLLMVGNSFSEAHSLEDMVQAMLEERKILLQADSIFAARFDQGGAHLENYVNNTALANLLGERQWTWVVLQEQSELPGFIDLTPADDNGQKWYETSLKAVVALQSQIQANGATTVLFQTWGYFDKDPHNPGYYSNYTTMQAKLNKGYQKYQDTIRARNSGALIKIAPAGSAFEWIYSNKNDNDPEYINDPLQTGSAFDQLYDTLEAHKEQDSEARKYPSVQGAYLTACVLFQTLTGLDVRQISYMPPSGMDVKTKQRLQKAAYATVMEYLVNNQNGKGMDGGGAGAGSGGGLGPSSSSTPKKPYKPYEPPSQSSSSYSSSSGVPEKSRGFRTLFLLVVVVGVGMLVFQRRHQHAYDQHRERFYGGYGPDYNWNPLATNDCGVMRTHESVSNLDGSSSYELTDMPHQQHG